jgi:diguanylate cyclase (GGDEF)-like protein
LSLADASLLAQASRVWPATVMVAVAVFAWRLHNTRIFSANLLIAAGFLASQPALFREHALAQTLLATFTPAGIALLAFGLDGAGTFARMRNHLLLAFGPLLAAAFFSAGNPARALANLSAQLIDPVYTDWSGLPQVALIVCAGALIALGVKFLLTPRPVEAALLWVALTMGSALAVSPSSTARGVWMLAGAVVLVVALVESAHSMAFHDELTGLPGRRALNHALSSLRAPYAIAIIDIDHFKSFNDEHGHDIGDQVLRMVAARLRAVTGGGVAYRSGGEEFTIVFAGMEKREAADHVEAVREAVANSRFALRRLPRPRQKKGEQSRGRGNSGQRFLQVTISVGVAAATEPGKSVESIIAAADQAMYRAKNQGRNRVVA